MRRLLLTCLGLAFVLALVGCGKGSSVEGRVLGRTIKPIAGLNIVAKQAQPLKGYERVEAITKGDGAFRLTGLYPSSLYLITISAQTWKTDVSLVITTAPDGETLVIERPLIVIRAISRHEEIEVDPSTGEKYSAVVRGQLVDNAGKPIIGAKAIATQKPSIAGYGLIETTTGPDGVFNLAGLYPGSTYSICFSTINWVAEESVEIDTRADGKSSIFPSPIKIINAFSRQENGRLVDPSTGKMRFYISSEDVIIDSLTGMQWIIGPDMDTKFEQGRVWINKCIIGGGRWRMPTCEELRGLYVEGIKIDSVFKTSGSWAWAAPNDTQYVWVFSYNTGSCFARLVDNAYGGRVFGVRLP